MIIVITQRGFQKWTKIYYVVCDTPLSRNSIGIIPLFLVWPFLFLIYQFKNKTLCPTFSDKTETKSSYWFCYWHRESWHTSPTSKTENHDSLVSKIKLRIPNTVSQMRPRTRVEHKIQIFTEIICFILQNFFEKFRINTIFLYPLHHSLLNSSNVRNQPSVIH